MKSSEDKDETSAEELFFMAETEKEDRDEETSLAMIMIEDDAQMKEFCLFGGPGTRRNPILKPGRNQCDQ